MRKIISKQDIHHYPLMAGLTALFTAFIAWIIYLADTGQGSHFFQAIQAIPAGDKMGHFTLFGLLSLFVNSVCRFKQAILWDIKIYYGSAVVLVFVLLEELSQHFFSTRTLDFFDLLADGLGILFFSLLARRFIEPSGQP